MIGMSLFMELRILHATTRRRRMILQRTVLQSLLLFLLLLHSHCFCSAFRILLPNQQRPSPRARQRQHHHLGSQCLRRPSSSPSPSFPPVARDSRRCPPWGKEAAKSRTILAMASTATAVSSILQSSNDTTHTSSSSSNKNKKKSHELNALLNSLAEQASDPSHNPIASAARVEDTWRRQQQAKNSVRKEEDTDDEDNHDDAIISFNIVLKGWRNCCQCLAENEIQFDAHDVASVPIYTAYDAAQHALRLLQERRGDNNNKDNEDADDAADDAMSRSSSIDTTSYNIVMDAFVKSRHAHAVEHVASLFQQLSRSSSSSSSSSNSSSSDESSSSSSGKSNKHVHLLQPDVYSWNALLDAYAYSDREDRLDMLEKLWKQMKKSSTCRPTVRTINSIIHAYSRPTNTASSTTSASSSSNTLSVAAGGGFSRGPSKKSGNNNNNAYKKEQWERYAAHCEDILQEMKETYKETHNPSDQPDVMTYTNLMHLHSRRGTLEAAQRAEQLYLELKHLHDTTGKDRFQPSVYTYTCMILIWARTPLPDAPQKAEAWLQRLLSDPNVKPNTKGYTACMQAWARSFDTARAAKALQLLQQMKASNSAKPNLYSYQMALEACCMGNATPHQQTAALKIAFAIFRAAEQDENVKVNPNIFATLLRTVSVLLPPAASERQEISTAVFRKACKAGQVNDNVIKGLQQCVNTKVLHSLLEPGKMIGEHGEIRFDNIPAAWCKHVRSG